LKRRLLSQGTNNRNPKAPTRGTQKNANDGSEYERAPCGPTVKYSPNEQGWKRFIK